MVNVRGLAKLELIALLTIFLIFGLIAGILGIALWLSGLSGFYGVSFALFLASVMIFIQWYIGPSMIKSFIKMKEMNETEYPDIFNTVKRLSEKAEIPMPKLYVVQDPSPNAFAFGRSQKSSNIAVHTGLLKTLEKKEIEAVLAHEIGHIKHRDVTVMTIASVLPLLLYYLILVLSPRDEREGGNIFLIFFGAMLAQFLGNLLVLWLSRRREYYADAFSGLLTENPRNLMTALAKISYSISNIPKNAKNKAMRAFYINDPEMKEDVSSILSKIEISNKEELMAMLKEEKKKAFLQIFMTHPLTVNRLISLASLL
jgi:heat shock protein HtpX